MTKNHPDSAHDGVHQPVAKSGFGRSALERNAYEGAAKTVNPSVMARFGGERKPQSGSRYPPAMHWLNGNAGGIEAIATVVLVLLTAVYASLTFRQAKAAERQVDATTRATRAQTILDVVGFLQAEHVRDARAMVRQLSPDCRAWSKDEERAAATVCASFDVVAMLVSNDLLDKVPFTTNWDVALVQCFRICEPFIEGVRADGAGPTYWLQFETAAREAGKKLREDASPDSWSSSHAAISATDDLRL